MSQILKIADAALVLDLHEQSVRALTRKGTLPDRRDQKNERFFLLDELLEFKRREKRGRRIGKQLVSLGRRKGQAR